MEIKKKIRISVRGLVEFLLRSGDLDNRRGGFRGAGGHADGQPAPPENSEEHGRGVSGRGASAV